MLALGAIVVALPLAGVAIGEDFLLHRNVIGALVALTIAAGIGFDRLRFGVPIVAGVCVIWIAITVATADEPKYRREDWRGAARATRVAEATLLVPRSGVPVAGYYRHGSSASTARGSEPRAASHGTDDGNGMPDPGRAGAAADAHVGARRGTCWEVDLRRWPTPRSSPRATSRSFARWLIRGAKSWRRCHRDTLWRRASRRATLLAALGLAAPAAAQVQITAPLDGAQVPAVAFGKKLVTANVTLSGRAPAGTNVPISATCRGFDCTAITFAGRDGRWSTRVQLMVRKGHQGVTVNAGGALVHLMLSKRLPPRSGLRSRARRATSAAATPWS